MIKKRKENYFHDLSLKLNNSQTSPIKLLEKLVAPIEVEFFSKPVSLQLGSWDHVLQWIGDICFFLVVHLNKWSRFLENFLAASILQQFQVKSSVDIRELKWLSLWRSLPNTLKIKTLFFIRADKVWLWRSKKKIIVPLSLWSDNMDIETIQKYMNISHLKGIDKILTSWDNAKNNVNRRLQLTDFC